MATKKKMLQAAAGQAGGAGLDVTEVFSTYLYEGTGTTQTITNGIDLAGEGGLVWSKGRSDVSHHSLFDTERGVNNALAIITNPEASVTSLTSFNSDGFSADGTWLNFNQSGVDYASWTFRKAPKFFDVVTYTGDGTTDHSHVINHNLGCEIGMVITKNTTSATYGDWIVDHRSFADVNGGLYLNTTDAQFTNNNIKNLTSTSFSVAFDRNNQSGVQYVAYLFAHNDGDGEFGPNGDQDIIKCGSYTGDGTDQFIDLGFEPQWLLIKNTSSAQNWVLFDTMRGLPVLGGERLYPNTSDAEEALATSLSFTRLSANGFELDTNWGGIVNASGDTYIYMAIRRGPLAPPESGTEVFAIGNGDVIQTPTFQSDFVTDLGIWRGYSTTHNTIVQTRLTQGKQLYTNLTNAEASNGYANFDYMDGFFGDASGGFPAVLSDYVAWMFRRAPKFFDVVAYTGQDTLGAAIPHNLGVAPELVIIKSRTAARDWMVALPLVGPDGREQSLSLNLTSGVRNERMFPSGGLLPDENNFYLASENSVNTSSDTYIAYLFATLPGVSKVGSYTGNSGTQTIDCGFTTGARFVMVKAANTSGAWFVWDTARGIVSGSEPYLRLNSSVAEENGYDAIDPDSSGFVLNNVGTGTNDSGTTYIFYAIA